MKHGTIVTLSALLLATACSNFKQVPILDMVEVEKGKWRCADEKLPYFYESSYAAVCLPREVVAFTVCVERLGLAETGGERGETTDRSFALEVPKVDVKAETTIKTEQKASVTTKFVSDGPLAEARARALDKCAAFLGKPPEKT